MEADYPRGKKQSVKKETNIMKVLDNRNDIDLTTGNFATLSSIRGKQFGRDVYSTVIRFKDLEYFLEIFPNVQRNIIPRKVASLRRYILSGLGVPTTEIENIEGDELTEEEAESLRFFSAVTVTCKGFMFYDEANKRVAIDINESKLSINDGQHRFEAIRTAIEYLEKEFVKSKDKNKTARLNAMIDELVDMTIPVVIFNGLSSVEEKQLFHDLNNLAQRPSRNANIRLNQRDLYSRMSREVSEENKYLKHYGIEYDKMSIQTNNPNTILLSTVYASIKELLHHEYKINKNFLNHRNYNSHKKNVNDTFDKLFYALPHDINIKEKYIIEKSFAIKAICKFISNARNHLDLKLTDEQIFEVIGSIDWTYNIQKWSIYGGVQGEGNNIVFGGGTGGGYKAVYSALMDKVSNLRVRRGTVNRDVVLTKKRETEVK
jgi:DNA sulfur modification protein DndB